MMPPMGSHSKLGRADRWWLGIAVGFAIAGMLTGFWFSFSNLTEAARAHHWATPYMLPLMIDVGIPTYVIIDHLIVRLGWKSRLPRLAAWGFAALTISLNGAAAVDASLLWRVVAAAAPTAWVLGIEVLRLVWRALRKDPAARPDRIPAGRWAASPLPTLLLWRRMHLLAVTSWPMMTALEDARLYAADVVTAARTRRPDLPVPLTVARAIRSGRFPADVTARVEAGLSYGGAATWEPAVNDWLASRLGLPEAISDVLSNERQASPRVLPGEPPAPMLESPPQAAGRAVSGGVPGAPLAHPSEPAPSTAPATHAKTSSRTPRPKPRAQSDDELMEFVRPLFRDGETPSQGAVATATKTAAPRAKRLRERAIAELAERDEAAPFPIHAVN